MAGTEASGHVLNSAVQFWDLHFAGTFTGDATVIIHFDPTLIGGVNPSSLQLWHSTGGEWVQVANQVIDPVADTITFTTDSFSPFVLGVPEPATIALAALGGIAPTVVALGRGRRN